MNGKNNTRDKEKHEETLYNYVYENFVSIYREHTRILSSTCRQLALGEGGLCWLFKSFTYGQCISYQANIVLVLLVLFFLFDAAQYLISSGLYKNKAEEYNEKISKGEIKNVSQLTEPPSINKPGSVCFIIKLSILVFASIYLIFLILKV
jgi:hypothetical protein